MKRMLLLCFIAILFFGCVNSRLYQMNDPEVYEEYRFSNEEMRMHEEQEEQKRSFMSDEARCYNEPRKCP
jgi:hypothetical protein